MPFTPFHIGPGTLAKSVAPHRFSFRAFVLSQVVIDCETAWNIYRDHERLHTDMWALAPFSDSNTMLEFVSVRTLHMACLWSVALAGLVGGIHLAYRKMRGTQT